VCVCVCVCVCGGRWVFTNVDVLLCNRVYKIVFAGSQARECVAVCNYMNESVCVYTNAGVLLQSHA
jgi:hypothetical protein